MATCDEQHKLASQEDDNVDTACPTPVDCIQNHEDEDGSQDECEDVNINSWKTADSRYEGEQTELLEEMRHEIDMPNASEHNTSELARGEENANIDSWRTNSFYDDRYIQPTMQTQETDRYIQDPPPPPPMQTQETQWIPVPVHVAVPVIQENVSSEQLLKMAADLEAEAAKLRNSTNTTVMMRNIPNNVIREQLIALIEGQNFDFDFFYLPMDFKRDANLGYAFVNLLSPDEANRFYILFQGFDKWGLASEKVCEVCWGNPLQGKDAHVDRYRNSPVMHFTVPDEHKPIIRENGQRIAFPPPTKRLRPPRTSDKA